MQIFRVVFIHDDNDYDLGLHASILSAQQRIEAAKKLPGFCDIPSNALILPYSLIGSQTEPGVVYDTSVYCHDEWFDYEYTRYDKMSREKCDYEFFRVWRFGIQNETSFC